MIFVQVILHTIIRFIKFYKLDYHTKNDLIRWLFGSYQFENKLFDVTQKNIELTDFLKDIFSSYYTEFLLNFGTEELMSALAI